MTLGEMQEQHEACGALHESADRGPVHRAQDEVPFPVAGDGTIVGLGRAAELATEALPEAAATASWPVVSALLAAGADARASDSDGMSALRLAVRAGKEETAARLDPESKLYQSRLDELLKLIQTQTQVSK